MRFARNIRGKAGERVFFSDTVEKILSPACVFMTLKNFRLKFDLRERVTKKKVKLLNQRRPKC